MTASREPTTMRRAVVYRPDSAVFWVFIAALAVGVVLLLAEVGSVFDATLDAHTTLAPLWLAFVAFMVWLMLRFDPFRAVRPHPQMLLAGASLGGTVAIVMSLRGNSALDRLWALIVSPETLGRWSAALTAPIIEEASKAACAAVILALCAGVCMRPVQALMVGMFTGFGFDVVEDLTYASNEAVTSLDSDLSGAGTQLFIRTITAFPAHWSYTGVTTVGVLLLVPWFANPDGWGARRRTLTAAALLVAGPVMHFIWNAPPFDPIGAFPTMVVKMLINLGVFLTIAFAVIRTERRWIAARVSHFADGVEPLVVQSLTSRPVRREVIRTMRRDGGKAAVRRFRRQRVHLLDLIQADDPTSPTSRIRYA